MIMGKLALIPVVLRFFVLFLKNYLDLVHVCSYIYARNWLYKWGVMWTVHSTAKRKKKFILLAIVRPVEYAILQL